MNMHNQVVPPRMSRRRFSVNITPAERIGRIVLGAAAIVAAIALLVDATSAVAIVLEILFAGVGLDLIITGTLGHCPLYQKLGFIPRSIRSRP